MSTCVALVSDCLDCARSLRSFPHQCDDLCTMAADLLSTPAGHAAYHAAQKCRRCGHPKWDDNGRALGPIRRCTAGRCNEFLCGGCGDMYAMDGPVGCPCSSRFVDRAFFGAVNWITGLVFRLRGKP